MADHPFVQRIRIEREIVREVNAALRLGRPLAGLGKEAIAGWASQIADQEKFFRIHQELNHVSRCMRDVSDSSHRGVIDFEVDVFEQLKSLERVRAALEPMKRAVAQQPM